MASLIPKPFVMTPSTLAHLSKTTPTPTLPPDLALLTQTPTQCKKFGLFGLKVPLLVLSLGCCCVTPSQPVWRHANGGTCFTRHAISLWNWSPQDGHQLR